MKKREVKLWALRWCLGHLYHARRNAASCPELAAMGDEIDEVFDVFLAEIDRLCKPLEHRLLRMERKR